jgi:hypothetical protein
VEPFGEFDDQTFGSADVAEEKHVLVVHDLPDRVPAGVSDAVDDAVHVVDGERDVPEPSSGGRHHPMPRQPQSCSCARAAPDRLERRFRRSCTAMTRSEIG